MKKNVLFVSLGVVLLLSMNACKKDALDLDKELKFSKLTVEEQKASIEQNGMDFISSMEGLQETKAMTAVMNMISMTNNQAYSAPMKRLVSDVKNKRQNAFSNFDRQLRVTYVDSELWGEYSYNFNTEEMVLIDSTLTNKIIINFPATEGATTNNGKITVTYEESTVEIPETGEMFPSKITFLMTVSGAEVMSANFSGKYYSDGMPQDVSQSLKIDTYTWSAQIKNDKKSASESYEFKKGNTILLKSGAEINGTLTESALTAGFENDTPENAISDFAIFFQVMDIGVRGGTTNFKGFATEIKAVDEKSEKVARQKYADILNKYMVCTAFFVEKYRKFAEMEFYVSEYTYQDYDYSSYPYQMITKTDYSLTPRFVLSDGSKVSAEEYVSGHFEDLITKIQNMNIQ